MDTGRSVTVLTDDHRVATHKQERCRLEKKGSIIAPVDIDGAACACAHTVRGCCTAAPAAPVHLLTCSYAWLDGWRPVHCRLQPLHVRHGPSQDHVNGSWTVAGPVVARGTPAAGRRGWVAGGGPATRKGATGVGPLRLWPGGLCLSRALGDFDVGDSVLCLPYISQVASPAPPLETRGASGRGAAPSHAYRLVHCWNHRVLCGRASF